MSQRILKPLDYGGLLDETFDLYKNNFLLLTGISAIVLIPCYLLHAFIKSGLLLYLTCMPLNYIISAATTYAVSRRYLGEEATILSSYRFLKKRFWAFAGTIILISFMINLGSALFVIPGILFYFLYIFVPQVFTLEGLSYSEARRRSSDLLKYNYWKVIVVNIFIGLIYWIVAFLLFLLIKNIVPYGYPVINMLTPALFFTLIIPFYTTVIVLLYYDFRVRYEGFDIEMLAQSINKPIEDQPQTAQPV